MVDRMKGMKYAILNQKIPIDNLEPVIPDNKFLEISKEIEELISSLKK